MLICFHHCYCKMLSNGVFYCCRCGSWEVIEENKKENRKENKYGRHALSK